MEVILQTDIAGLGEEGAIVRVAPGYARNYLLPQKKALQYNNQNLSILKSRKKAIEKRQEERRLQRLSLVEKLQKESLTVIMKADEKGHLYGGVSTQMISELLHERGLDVPKSAILLSGHSIKELGVYEVAAKIHNDQVKFSVTVTSDASSPDIINTTETTTENTQNTAETESQDNAAPESSVAPEFQDNTVSESNVEPETQDNTVPENTTETESQDNTVLENDAVSSNDALESDDNKSTE